MKVLLVDDDPAMRRLIRRVLWASFEAEVREVDGGVAALERLQDEAFDLVILDMQMPVIDGAETLQALRRTATFRNLPVVVISGAVDEGRIKQLRGLNVTEIIAKPFTPRTLQTRLAPLMTRLKDEGASAPTSARARLNLRPDSRLLLVGPKDRFQDFLLDHLDRVCDVAAYASAATALRDALSRTPDGIFITGDDFLLPPALFAQKVSQANPRPRVYLCELSAAPFSDDGRWFDGRLQKVSTHLALFKGLRPLLTNSGLALALLPATSPLIQAMWTSAADTIQRTLHTPVSIVSSMPAWRSSDHRTIEASAHVTVDEVAWHLTLLVTYDYGLRHASTLGGGVSLDKVSEADVLDAATAFLKMLALNLRESLVEYDISARLGPIAVQSTDGYARFGDQHLVRWLTEKGAVFVAAVRIAVATEPKTGQVGREGTAWTLSS